MEPNDTKTENAGQESIETGTARLPEYQCHKVVQGAKIMQVNVFHDGAELLLDVLDGQPISHHATLEWHNRHRPKPGGYLVRYKDGYESYSPADSFEDGYRLINHSDNAG